MLFKALNFEISSYFLIFAYKFSKTVIEIQMVILAYISNFFIEILSFGL